MNRKNLKLYHTDAKEAYDYFEEMYSKKEKNIPASAMVLDFCAGTGEYSNQGNHL